MTLVHRNISLCLKLFLLVNPTRYISLCVKLFDKSIRQDIGFRNRQGHTLWETESKRLWVCVIYIFIYIYMYNTRVGVEVTRHFRKCQISDAQPVNPGRVYQVAGVGADC